MGKYRLKKIIRDLRAEEIFCEEAVRMYSSRLSEIRRVKTELEKDYNKTI